MGSHPARACIVSGQSKIIATKFLYLFSKISRATPKVLGDVPWIGDTKVIGSSGHQLSKAYRTFGGQSVLLITAFLRDQRVKKTDRDPLFTGNSSDKRKQLGTAQLGRCGKIRSRQILHRTAADRNGMKKCLS